MSPFDLQLTPTGLHFWGRRFPCTIGRGGLTHSKREGDGATPQGSHKIVGMLYRPDRVKQPTPWAKPITNNDLWSDDASDSAYNQWVRAPYPHSHERLRRSDPLYDIVLVSDWNWPDAVSGKGSAIFLHQYRRPGFPTEGCIAFRRDHLHWIAQRVTLGTTLVIS